MDTAICFADVDTTLIYSPQIQQLGGQLEKEPDSQGLYAFRDMNDAMHSLLRMPASTSHQEGFISISTLQKLAKIRSVGIPVVLMSGTPTSMLMQRLPFLPIADAYVSENGGHIFYHRASLPSAFGLIEDIEWRKEQDSIVGPQKQESQPPEKRTGVLWDLYRALQKSGWDVDASGCTTCIRLKSPPKGKALEDIVDSFQNFPNLGRSYSLGTVTVHGGKSGMDKAASYLMHRFNAAAENSVFLHGDDGSMELAKIVGKAIFLPTSERCMKQAVEEDLKHFEVISTVGGTLATDKALDAVLEYYEIVSESETDDGTEDEMSAKKNE